METKIPFQPEFKVPMLTGKKTATTRSKRYGYPGDWFPAFGKVFVLTQVYPSFLDVVISHHYLEEGSDSPQEFIECWDRLHPQISYLRRPGRSVFFHRFTITQKAHPQTRTVEATLIHRFTAPKMAGGNE